MRDLADRFTADYRRLRDELQPPYESRSVQRRKAAMRRDHAYLHDLGCDGTDCACRTVYRVEVVE